MLSKALFDPRIKGQMWPEPNDDPNIPYNWGLDGYICNDGVVSKQGAGDISPFNTNASDSVDAQMQKSEKIYTSVAMSAGFIASDIYKKRKANVIFDSKEVAKTASVGALGYIIGYGVSSLIQKVRSK